MKITKDTPHRFFASGLPASLSSRGEDPGTEPVHTVVADRDAATRGRAAAQHQEDEASRKRASGHALPPTGEERRKNDRRKRQVDVVLDTRVTPSRRQYPSIDVKA